MSLFFEIAPPELKNILEFILEGKYEYALQLLSDYEGKKDISLQESVLCHLLKTFLFMARGLYNKAVDLAEQTYKESLDLDLNIITIDALLLKADALIEGPREVEKANRLIKRGEELLNSLTEESEINRKKRLQKIVSLKGRSLDPNIVSNGDPDIALEYYEQSLSLAESLGNINRISLALLRIAWIVSMHKGELDLSLSYANRALNYLKDSNSILLISLALLTKATIYSLKGELAQSISIYKQLLTAAKAVDHKAGISTLLNNMADTYRMKGDLEQALEYSEESVNILSETGELMQIAGRHDFLIQILIDKGDLGKAEYYLKQLEKLNKQLNNKKINMIYLLNKALLLKESSRLSSRVKAEEILKKLLQEFDLQLDTKISVLLRLSEILLEELKITGDPDVLTELESNFTQLLEIAEKSRSYWVWGETFLLQAKLALISLKLNDARRLLTQGQKIAEKHDIHLLARKISNEHDELLKQLDMWEKLKESKAPITDRLELSRLNGQMKTMIQRRVIEPPEIEEEEPIVILFISEAGIPLFSQSFAKEWEFQDHLFGGFLTAVNSFSDEMFSNGLDRASFGEYTLFMSSASPFLVCYLFKGQSYSAQSRLNYFLEKIKNDKEIWQSFEKYYHRNQEISIKDIPSLEPLISQIFIEKTIDFNV